MASDRTWNRFGRRLPYLICGAVVAALVMCMLPNAGSLHFTISAAILFGLVALMLLDTSINMAMQPFKMLVGDMVNEKQKGLAYSIQSFLCNAGSIVGYIFPLLLGFIGLSNVAPTGVVPDTVIWSFYLGAAILILCVIYSLVKIKEWPPHIYNEYNGVQKSDNQKGDTNLFRLLAKAPTTFWTVGIVQFFCWFAFLFLWTYATNTVAFKAFDTPTTETYTGLSYDGRQYAGKYLIVNDNDIVLEHGKKVGELPSAGNFRLTTADIVVKHDNGSIEMSDAESYEIADASQCSFSTRTVLDASTEQYNNAGNWVGLLYAVQALGSVVWAMLLPRFRSRKLSYALSLLLGAAGFIMMSYVTNQYVLFIAFLLIGCAWAAMLAWPFTILTNSLKSGNIGTYLGLFNCTICIPQIIAAIVGGWILSAMSVPGQLAPEYNMMLVAGISIAIGALCVGFINEGSSSKGEPVETPAVSDNI